MSIYDSFTRRNSLIKTLQFKLTPVYSTAAKMQEQGVVAKDVERSACRDTVVKVLGRLYAAYINDVLGKGVELDWQGLADYLNSMKSTYIAKHQGNIELDDTKLHNKSIKNKSDDITSSYKKSALLKRQQAVMRKAVAKLLTNSSAYKNLLNPTKAIKLAAGAVQNEDEAQALACYARFTTVLTSYFESQKAYFTHQPKKNAIAYRIVNENFPIYVRNLEMLKQCDEAGLDYSDEFAFPWLDVNGYNACLVQEHIDAYNMAIRNIKKDLCYLKESKQLPKALNGIAFRLKPLQKQILSVDFAEDKTGFTSFDEVRIAVMNLQKSLAAAVEAINSYDNSILFDDSIEDCTSRLNTDESKTIETLPNKVKLHELLQALTSAGAQLRFKEHEQSSITSIKNYLDTAIQLRRWVKACLKEQGDTSVTKNNAVNEALTDLWELLEPLSSLYNQARLYLTRKPYSREKMRLFFDCAAFGKGWDVNKESAYLVMLFRRQNKYYLGVRCMGAKIDFAALADAKAVDGYEKMVYKAFDFVKGMPAVLFSKLILQKFVDGADEVVFDSELYSRPLVVTKADFEQKYYVQNGKLCEREPGDIKYLKEYLSQTGDEAGYKQAVYQRIDLAMRFIQAYKAFNFFDLSELKPTEEYESWTEFLLHVNQFTYGIQWQRIPEQALKKLIEQGDLFFFQLDNQDFVFQDRGVQRQENEQTQLLRQLFSDVNAKERVLKLLGDVAVYYRPASAPRILSHKKDSVLVNKKDTQNQPFAAEVHRNLCRYLNGREEQLLPEAKELLKAGLVRYKAAATDIIKDKRYTENQISVSFPIALNYNRKQKNDGNIRRQMLQKVENVLAVHLGTKNLAGVIVLDKQGQTLYQKAYNEFNQYNYARALELRNAARRDAQRSWQQMEQIKNLRQGFTSALINEVSRLAIEYDAVIILEDYRFVKAKHGKDMHFALGLLQKLNYLVIKGKGLLEPGGLLNAYQLVPKVESIKDIGKQLGCVFLVKPVSHKESEPFADCLIMAKKGLDLLAQMQTTNNMNKSI